MVQAPKMLAPEDMRRMLEHMIKLTAEGKITKDNAWDCSTFINEMPNLIKQDLAESGNFQKASCGLEAGVVVYSKRVDSTYDAVYQTMQGVKGTAGPAAGADSDGEGAANQDQGAGGEASQQAAAGSKRSKQSSAHNADPSSTLSTAAALRDRKTDTTFESDPLFRQVTKLFDENSPSGLLLLNYPVQHRTHVLFDGAALPIMMLPTGLNQHIGEPDKQLDLSSLPGLPNIINACARQHITPCITSLRQELQQALAGRAGPVQQLDNEAILKAALGVRYMNPNQPLASQQQTLAHDVPANHDQDAGTQDGATYDNDMNDDAMDIDDGPQDSFYSAHDDGETADVQTSAGNFSSPAGGLAQPGLGNGLGNGPACDASTAPWLQDDAANGGSWGSVGGFGGSDDGLDDVSGAGAGGLDVDVDEDGQQEEDVLSALPAMSHDTSGGNDKLKSWINMQWRHRTPRTSTSTPKPRTTRPKIAKAVIDMTCPVQDIPEDAFAKTLPKRRTKKLKLLPEHSEPYQASRLFHLGCSEQLAPQRYWLIQQKAAAQQRHGAAGARRAGPVAGMPADGAGLTADQVDGPDQHFTGDGFNDGGFADNGAGEIGFADDDDAGNFTAGNVDRPYGSDNGTGNGWEGSAPAADADPFSLDVLMPPPSRKVQQIQISYDKTAKQVDVKALKDCIKGRLTTLAGDAVGSQDTDSHDQTQPAFTFHKVIKDIPLEGVAGVGADGQVSVHLAFICLLHLANENGLALGNKGRLDQLDIKMPAQ